MTKIVQEYAMSVSCRKSFQQRYQFSKKSFSEANTIRCDIEVQSSVIEQLDLESNVNDPGSLSSSSSSDFSPQQKRMKLIEDSQQNRQSLKNLAMMCERY